MMLRRVSDDSLVRLGRELGRGGEGVVHEISSDDLVAKIYLRPPPPAKIEKLRAMTRRTTPALERVAAWPVDLLQDHTRRVRGFLMPRVSAREDVHQLYSPKSRRRAFVHSDARFLVRTAANLARAFATLHDAGHVIGDVNHGNALIGQDGTVVLIDCDSFQVRDAAGRVFTCDVGVPLFTAPELQGKVFRGLRRSRQHDDFGLAVLVFHLLFQGRHPYAGRYVDGEMPIERAIAESRFAYGQRAAARGMTSPPATLPLDAFGGAIADLFERAFADGPDPHRPPAMEWVAVLTALERALVPCSVSAVHFHVPGGCCWCALERSGIRLFGSLAPSKLARETIDALWSAVRAVRRPAKDVDLAGLPPLPPDSMPRRPRPGDDSSISGGILFAVIVGTVFVSNAWGVAAGLGFLFVAGITGFIIGSAWLRERRAWNAPHRELAKAQSRWRALLSRWNAECSPAPFKRELARLASVRLQLEDWENQRRKAIRAARREQEQRDRQTQLARFRIDAADLGLRPEDIAALASLGIETAADVVRENARALQSVPSPGSHLLTTWAAGISRRFRVKRTAPLDAEVSAEMERRLAERQQELVQALREGPARLEQARVQIEEARAALAPEIKAARKALEDARTGG
jgi:DNA-binding helix-hairpin-helix protein with protein kinase domain